MQQYTVAAPVGKQSFLVLKEVELYFARKLLAILSVPTPDKLLVSKEKVSDFLHWMENR